MRKHLKLAIALATLIITGCATSTPSYAQPPVRTLSAKLVAGADWRSYSEMKLFQEPIDFASVDKSRLNAACYHETNARRVSHGLKALPYHEALESAAQIYAEVLVRDNFFSHNHPSNSSLRAPEDRGRAAGIVNPKLAENIAITIAIPYRSGDPVYPRGSGRFSYSPEGPIIPAHSYASFAKAVLDQWMNSPGHRQNVLSTSAVALGCGASFFWQDGFPAFKAVQNFQFFEPVRVNAARSHLEPAPAPRQAAPQQPKPAPREVATAKPSCPAQEQEPQHPKPTSKGTTKITTTHRGGQTIKKTVITRERDGYTETEEIVEVTTH